MRAIALLRRVNPGGDADVVSDLAAQLFMHECDNLRKIVPIVAGLDMRRILENEEGGFDVRDGADASETLLCVWVLECRPYQTHERWFSET